MPSCENVCKLYWIVAMAISLVYFGAVPAANAQVGLSGAFQANQTTISVPVWAGKRVIFEPSIGALYQEGLGLDFTLGFGVKVFFDKYITDGDVATYVKPRAGLFIFGPEEGENTIDLIFGAGFGADYFFKGDEFSIGVEAQLDLILPDDNSTRFSNPGNITVRTGVALTAAVYF